MSRRCRYSTVVLLSVFALTVPLVSAAPPSNEHFHRTWERTERPVMDQATSRTWMWGPSGRTGPITEPYLEAPDGYREVQYFDKTRMEINNPNADPDSAWYVTNGLLAKEMITGQIQVGHLTQVETDSARIQVAGDQHPDSPTYQTLSHLLDEPPRETGVTVSQRLVKRDLSYEVLEEDQLEQFEVTAVYHVPETDHTIAGPFWEFMNSEGLVFEGGINVQGTLFVDPFFATGLPITEAYWVYVPVDGNWRDVLLQCFERRCLTYTPDNPSGWQVEAGNIGLHYHQYRYGHGPEVLDCVELNLATVQDLVQITHVGEARARAIMEMRPFDSIEDLERVSGIGPATVELIVDQGLACVEYEVHDENDFHQSR